MTTKEMEQMLGITKATLIYYEKEGFIKPERGDNNYRDYSQKDIEIVKFIMLMRSMQLSIDDIHLIFEGELSIREALEARQEYLKKEHLELAETEQKIKDYVKRHAVIVEFDKKEKNDDTLFFKEFSNIKYPVLNINSSTITFGNIKVKAEDIKKVKLSMCSQVQPIDLIRVYTMYYVDFDLITSLDTYSYQMINSQDVQQFLDFIKNYQIAIDDPLNIVSLYEKYPDHVTRNHYLDVHFKNWAKEYHLDNPRKVTSIIAKQYDNASTGVEKAQILHDNFKKDFHNIKNIWKRKK